VDLDRSSIDSYVRHAFAGMERVLDRLDDESVNRRPDGWGTNSVAALIVHCCELTPWWIEMPGLGRDAQRDRDAEFVAVATVEELRQRIDVARRSTSALIGEFVAGRTARDHPLREILAGDDRTDGALVLHVLEELFQHLGHMEVTADALAGGRVEGG